MSFNSHSLKRLEELGRQLPKEIKKNKSSNSQPIPKKNNQKLHPVETEENPEQLFRELMEVSPDGIVPDHLLNRLKKLESNKIKTLNDQEYKSNSSEKLSTNETINLYTAFQQLLLEDDI